MVIISYVLKTQDGVADCVEIPKGWWGEEKLRNTALEGMALR